ncbi:MAG TPA: glycosyltransferase family 39 protein [Bacteroides sp.]|nr:glycosyltransferase family 39 protein [Bacteroides sp.]
MKLKIRQEHILLLLILVLGTILRTYKLQDIPFTHDELSVVFRSGYTSFSELITDGIMPDVHPAGVQVFMNYWVAVFGDSEVAVKFPFILFGILSIFLVYRLGKDWFGEDVGLASAAFVSAMEYMIMHSQTARPYASGLFFSLLMVYAWQRYLFSPGKRQYLWLTAYVVASAICAYNHYFSLMFAAITAATGIFFINRRQILPYLIGCLSIFILFIPHLRIFFFQFRQKGVGGWLGKPDNDYIFDYLGYVFQYSPYILVIVAGIIIAGIISGESRKLLRNRFFYISLAWFFIPFLTAFFYSRYVNAVLQLRVMIFFFPFLLFLITGNLPALKKPFRIILPMLICLVVSLSLILERRYYKLFYKSCYQEIIVETDLSIKEVGKDNCLVFIDSHKRISEYYYDRLDIQFDHYRMDGFENMAELTKLLGRSNAKFVSLGVDSRSELVLPSIILDHYPNMVKKIDYQGGNYYLFSKDDSTPYSNKFSSTNNFNTEEDHWSHGVDSLYTDSAGISGSTAYFLGNSHEFGPTFSVPLNVFADHKNDLIDVSVSVRNLDSLNNGIIVLSLRGKEELVVWRSAFLSDYDPLTGEWYTAHHTFRPGPNFKNPDLELQVYVWNKEKERFLIDDFRVRTRPGNPLLFGLTEKL